MPSPKELAHLQISLAEVRSATNKFADENIIGEGGLGKVYKGKLTRSGELVNVAARRLDRRYGLGRKEFWTEISMLSSLEHKNLVSLVGYCDEENEKIIVNRYDAKGSLKEYLSGSTLTWMQRVKICVGVANALKYLHDVTGRHYSVIHHNINSSTILLDDNWEAKLSGFEFSLQNPGGRTDRVILTELTGTQGYEDPEHEKTGGVSHESDVYAFGVVLFEVLCGREAFIRNDKNRFLAPLAKFQYDNGKLYEMIDPVLWKQMDPQSFIIFSQIAYSCLNRERSHRPNMDEILYELVEVLNLQQKHENPEKSTDAVETTASNYPKGKDLDRLKIPLHEIKLATNNFDRSYMIGSGGSGMTFKAELDLSSSFSPVQWPKRRITVAIKRIFSRHGDAHAKQGFFVEVEALSNCKHCNVVNLVGFCDEAKEMILVYEYASNGSLDDFLGSSGEKTILTWPQRLKICLDIAHGLNFLHSNQDHKERIIHRDIKSANILLDDDWKAKITDFGLSTLQAANQKASTIQTRSIAGTEVYMDPEYMNTGKIVKESDIYSFGVVLFEIMSGRVAYHKIYMDDNEKGISSFARQHFNAGTLNKMVDPKIKEAHDLNIFTQNRGPNQDSLDTFFKVAYQCLAEIQAERPTIKVLIKELEKALHFQENPKIPLKDIILATKDFSVRIGSGGFGNVYEAKVQHANGYNTVVAKQLKRSSDQGQHEFLTELQILFEYKHENVISLVGYCDVDDNIIVYEHASNGSLDMHLNNVSLMWTQRLKICIDVARGLDFLHGGGAGATQDVVIHRDLKSANILLMGDWKAKISDFGLSLVTPISAKMEFVIDHACGTPGYCDPLYKETGFLTKESDIYSFGVVLFEILSGRFASEKDNNERLTMLVKQRLKEGKLDHMVFEGIKEHMSPKSLTTFQTIAYQCLADEREKRPTAHEVVLKLQEALKVQEDYEARKPKLLGGYKLPRGYQQLIHMSKSHQIYSTKKMMDL